MFKNFMAACAAMFGATVAFAQAAAPQVVTVTASDPGFIATVVAFAAGFLLTWPALIALIVLGVLFEHNGARGWAVFTALAVMVASYFFFNVSLLMIGVGAVAYIGIGLVWSWYRYKRHATNVVAAHRDATPSQKERALAALHPKAMLSTITAWIMIWPFSMVENVIGDIINTIQLLVTKFFRGVYHRIYDAAVSALKE